MLSVNTYRSGSSSLRNLGAPSPPPQSLSPWGRIQQYSKAGKIRVWGRKSPEAPEAEAKCYITV